MSDHRKFSAYFPEQMISELEDEAQRLDRSMSWLLQRAWITARDEIAKLPTMSPRMPA